MKIQNPVRAACALLLGPTLMAAVGSNGASTVYDFPGYTLVESVAGANDFVDACYGPINQEYWVAYLMGPGIAVQRIDAVSGSPVGAPTVLDVVNGPRQSFGVSIAFAASTGHFLVCFGRTCWLLDVSGAEIGGGPITLPRAWGAPASNGTDFLVAGCSFAQVIDSNGVLKGYASDSLTTDYGGAQTVAWLGGSINRYFVVWSETDSSFLSQKICGRTIGLDLAFGPTQSIGTIPVAGSGFARWPRVAADPLHNEWGVTWEETKAYSWAGNIGFQGGGGFGPGGGPSDDWAQVTFGKIQFRRLSADGTPLGTQATLSSPASIGVSPRIAWDNFKGEYVILWQGGALDYDDLIDNPAHALLETRIKGGTGQVVLGAVEVASLGSSDQLLVPALAVGGNSDEMIVARLRLSPDYYIHVEAEVFTKSTASPSPAAASEASGGGGGGGGGCHSSAIPVSGLLLLAPLLLIASARR